jgi:N-acetylmuramoyl-L-alanine amidase
MAVNKVILVYAHGGTKPNDPGAVNTKLNVGERDFIKTFFDTHLIPAVKAAGIKYSTVAENPNWFAIDKQVDAVYEKGDIAISCHLNASENATATGIETLHAKGSVNGERLAKLVQANLVKALGLKDRGLDAIVRDDRGGRLVAGTKPPCVLAELFFLSNEKDHAIGKAKQAEMAKAIVDAIKAY